MENKKAEYTYECPHCGSTEFKIMQYAWMVTPLENVDDEGNIIDKSTEKLYVDESDKPMSFIACAECGEIFDKTIDLDRFTTEEIKDALIARLTQMQIQHADLRSVPGYEVYVDSTLEEKEYDKMNLNKLIRVMADELESLEDENALMFEQQYDESTH